MDLVKNSTTRGAMVLAAVILMVAAAVVTQLISVQPPPQPRFHEALIVPQNLEGDLVQVIEKDDIAALLDISVVGQDQADLQMAPDEPVIGVSIDNHHRAYSLPLLTRHEIANDVLGGVPIAVTW